MLLFDACSLKDKPMGLHQLVDTETIDVVDYNDVLPMEQPGELGNYDLVYASGLLWRSLPRIVFSECY